MLKAVIFDMNGVIINDEEFHKQAWKQLAKKYEWNLSEEQFKEHVFGRTETDTFKYVLGSGSSQEKIDRYATERQEIAMKLFKPHLKPTEGFMDFIQQLKKNNIKIAIATSARRLYTNFILDNLNLKPFLYALQTAEDVQNGKPNPEIYQKILAKLEVEPTDAIVFEDSISGIKAAHGAELKVIALSTTHKPWELLEADKIITSFKGLQIQELL